MSTTVRSKLGSPSAGVATSNRPRSETNTSGIIAPAAPTSGHRSTPCDQMRGDQMRGNGSGNGSGVGGLSGWGNGSDSAGASAAGRAAGPVPAAARAAGTVRRGRRAAGRVGRSWGSRRGRSQGAAPGRLVIVIDGHADVYPQGPPAELLHPVAHHPVVAPLHHRPAEAGRRPQHRAPQLQVPGEPDLRPVALRRPTSRRAGPARSPSTTASTRSSGTTSSTVTVKRSV